MSNKFIQQFIEVARLDRLIEQGSYLFHQGNPVQSVYVIACGKIELIRHAEDGKSLVLQRATDHALLAEASVYSTNYHCDAIAVLPTSVYRLSKAAFLQQLHASSSFFDNWAAHLAREVQTARYRSEILSRKTVAERLDGWLDWPGNSLPDKGEWKNVSLEIGVSPEALYRELSKRKSGKNSQA